MKRLLYSLSIGAALLPSLAAAQTTAPSGRLDLVGEAASACTIADAGEATGSNATFQAAGAGAAEVRITELVDPVNGTPRASSINISLPIICNSAHRLVVRSDNGGLQRDGNRRNLSLSGGFREFLGYSLNAVWSGQSVTGASSEPLIISVDDGAAGTASLLIEIPGGGDPLIAGRYSDNVVIELQAQN